MAQLEREHFCFTQDFQDLILACILKRSEFNRYAAVIQAKYFSGSISTMTARAIFEYHKKSGSFPAKETLIQLMTEESHKIDDAGDEAVEYVNKLFKIKTHDWEFVHEKVIAFCRERAVLRALSEGIDHFKEGTQPDGGYVGLFERAVATGSEFDDLETLKFDPEAGYTQPEPVITLAGNALITPGNLGVIAGLPKVGKSAAITAILGAMIAKADRKPRDLLGFAGTNPNRKAVLHIDTEQSRFHHATLARRAMWRAGIKKTACLHSYCLTGLNLKGRLGALRNKASELAESQGLLAIVVDGVGDLCADPNDPKEAFALVDELHRLAVKHDCVVIAVLHENPAGATTAPGKTRGHLGSQLERKAELNLRLRKNTEGVTTMFTERSRNCHIAESTGPCFCWSDEEGTHVACASTRERKADAKTQALRELATAIFIPTEDGPARLRHKELVEKIMAHENLSERTAKDRVIALANEKLVRKLEDKTYSAGEDL